MRPNIFKVINPRSESSKYFERVPRDCHFFCTESAVYRPIRAPKNGISGKVRIQIRAESGSRKKMVVIMIKGVATELGYEDPLYFTRVFRAVVEMAPTAYRRMRKG